MNDNSNTVYNTFSNNMNPMNNSNANMFNSGKNSMASALSAQMGPTGQQRPRTNQAVARNSAGATRPLAQQIHHA